LENEMARSDLLTSLVRDGITGNKARFRKVAEAIVAEERAKRHTVLADKLEKILSGSSAQPDSQDNSSSLADHRIGNFVNEIIPERHLRDLILPKEIKEICEEIVEEHHRADLLRSYNLEPRNRMLLIGPPGNGKTSLAEGLAEALMVPLLVVRYESIVGTYLGETAVRLRRLVDYACTRRCVLFFDEFETLGKERGDIHETGEIKRVVSSLLLLIDSLPSHVVVIGATNHPELLDRAVWRRFHVRIALPEPTLARLEEWFHRFQERIKVPLGYAPSTLAKKLHGANFAEVEEFGESVFRKFVMSQPDANMKSIIDRTFKLWAVRSVKTEQTD
jgi:SpoVK/Ycf46/Vps4 family AAA+-type ATPase